MLLLLAACSERAPGRIPDPAAFVDPFIGTGGHGHTYPGATMPFGMVQLSPDTRLEGWDGCSGYHFSDSSVYGFSHTHLSGTGVSDYGDVLVTPGASKPAIFAKSSERASPGYYRVLLDSGIEVELTATPRVGIHRYRFPAGVDPIVSIDLRHRDTLIESSIDDPTEFEIVGHRRSRAWSQDQHVYFVVRFSTAMRATTSSENWGIEALLARGTREVVVAVGISAVSIEGARKNLEAEAPHSDFDRYRAAARAAWNAQLSKVSVRGGSRARKRTFYTALYHSFLAPNLFTDVDGQYRGTDLKVHRADGYQHYTVFSLWDTFRAAHPLFTLLETARTTDFVRTMLAHYEDGGSLPVWELAGWYTGCMIGYHSVPVIVDAHAKGIGGFDLEQAYEAMVHSASKSERGLPSYRENGFILAEKAGESVSRTLEYAYDDWCIAQVARELGKPEYETFLRRAQYYKNVFDPSTGFMRAKRNHVWVGPFEPREVNTHFTEANSWQYSLFAPHDIDGHRPHRPVRAWQRAEPPYGVSVLFRRQSVEDAAARAPDPRRALHRSARRVVWQRRLRADVRLVCVQRAGVLPGDARDDRVRHRHASFSRGDAAPRERQTLHRPRGQRRPQVHHPRGTERSAVGSLCDRSQDDHGRR
jgi:predicted alpha-1,2-mannosidase